MAGNSTTAWVAPTGPIEDKGATSKNLNIALMTIATVLYAHRVYIRAWLMKNWGADDSTSTVAFGLLMTLGALEIKAVIYGSGKHLVDIDPKDLAIFFFNLPTMQLLYLTSSYMIKLSILLFLRRFYKSVIWYRIVWGVIAVTTIQSVTVFMVFILQCKPPKALWDTTITGSVCMSSTNQAKLVYAHAGVGIAIDVFCLFGPIFIVWKYLILRDMKLRLTAVLGVGAVAVVCACIRLGVIVKVDISVDTTYTIRLVSIWTDLEGFLGFFVSCAPSIAPTIRFLRRTITGQSSSSRTSQGKVGRAAPLSRSERSSQLQSPMRSMHHGKGSGGEIPMYSVSHITKPFPDESDDNIPVDDDGRMYNNVAFQVHVEQEVFTTSKV